MMKNLLQFVLLLLVTLPCAAQAVNASQQVSLEGLLTQSGHGSLAATKFLPDGSLMLLVDEHDGLRLMKLSGDGSTVMAQAHNGATGDVGVAMAVDASGNVYVSGTTTSGTLNGTSGAAFSARVDTSTNSFLAKYDAGLNLVFLTFLGAGRTSATGVAATSDGAFVTGLTYSTAFPVTGAGIQQTPAAGSGQNGFVERFRTDGRTLMYATYLTGANGDTTPAGIAVDAADSAYVTGLTTASGYPTVAALEPAMSGSAAGFLTKLTPGGDGFVFSTFVAGGGMTSVALDASGASLLLSGNVSLGAFPVATVATPLVAAAYQSLLKIAVDGQSVSESVVLMPGSTSAVTAAADGAWVSGTSTTPLFPGDALPYDPSGDGFLVHVTTAGAIDQTVRLGGLPVNQAAYASLSSAWGAPAVSGTSVAVGGTLTSTVAASLAETERFDVPLVAAPNAALLNTMRDVVSVCASGQCVGTGGLLALLTTAAAGPSLSLSVDDLPNVTVRNVGSAAATGVVITASGYTVTSDCGTALAPSNACGVVLAGGGPGSLTISAANAASYTVTLPANTLQPDALALSTNELDFGVVTAASVVTRTITVTNVSGVTQTFSSALDRPVATSYTFLENASDCASGGSVGKHTLAAGAVCHITIGLTVSSVSANDGAASANWLLGSRDVLLTGFAQAAALSVSASTVDFGTQFVGGLKLPRYLYVSNNSSAAVAHATVATAAGSVFGVTDECPASLPSHSVCRLTITYASANVPAQDATTLTLDAGLSVLVRGATLPQPGATGSAANPNLSVSPTSIVFATPVVVTGVAGTTQTVTVTNTGANAMTLAVAISGDFTLTNGCAATLAGGASCQVLVGFAPSQPGARSGLLAVTGGSGFAPTYVVLSGTGTAILPANNGLLDLGETLVGEPVVAWYKVQQPLNALTATTSSAAFGVALVNDTGSGHGTLPASGFESSVTAACSNCWLGVQFLGGTAGTQGATLALSTVAAGNAYDLAVTATALPLQGLLLTPVTQDFGTVGVNSTSGEVTFTLANLLTTSLAVTVRSVTASGDFAVVANDTGGASCNGLLTATAACFVNVVFAPTAAGSRTGTLTVVTDSGTVTANLSGYGAVDMGLAINPTSLTFNNVPGTSATQQTIMLKNTSTGMLSVGVATVSNAAFQAATSCGRLGQGASCQVVVSFQAQAAPVAATLSLPVTATVNGQTSTTVYSVALAGNYAAVNAGLQILPGQANFAALATGALGQTRQFTVNNFSTKTMSVSLALPRQFPLTAPSSCTTLAAGASCLFSVSFLPVTSGEATGTVTATGVPSDGSAAVQALGYMIGYGSGLGTVSIAPSGAVNFGQTTSGQSVAKTLTLSNSGTANVTVRRVTSQPPFLASTNCGALLAASASCAVTLTYAPVDEIAGGGSTASRTDNGTLVVESDAAASPQVVALSGSVMPVVSSSPASAAVLDALVLSESAVTFANTAVGSSSASQTVTLTNAGTTTIHVAGVSVPVDYTEASSCGVLPVGQSCTITVAFAPTAGANAVRSGTMEIASDAATALEYVSLLATSTAAPLTLSPAALDFGTVNVGANGQLSVSLTNNSAVAVTFTAASASGDYSVARGTCPANGATLAAGASCSLVVVFTPAAAGTRVGTLSLSTDATALPLTVALTGVGALGTLTVTPGALAFGAIAVGAPAQMRVMVLNTGSATVTGITASITGANASDFAVTVPCSVTQLAPNQGCEVTVTFTPSAAGAETAALRFASSDPASPAVVALSGSGIAGGTFTLTVNGGSAATVTAASGSPAKYTLLLTAVNGYSGQVALTCTPVVPAQYASCSLLASTVTLNGGVQASTATINTITSLARNGGLMSVLFLLVPLRRRRRLRWLSLLPLGVLAAMTGCGGGMSSNPNLRYTPAGTYQYQVTANSTSGTQIAQTVTLNLIVQ